MVDWVEVDVDDHKVVSTPLKNMIVKLDRETRRFGVKIKNIWNYHIVIFQTTT